MDRYLQRKDNYKNYISFNLKANSSKIILGITFIIGVFLGSMVIRVIDPTTKKDIITMLGWELSSTSNVSFGSIFSVTFWTMFAFLLVLFFCGFCAISQPVIILVILYQGLGFGLLSGYCYSMGGNLGLYYMFFVLTPKVFMSILLLIVASNQSIALSKKFLSTVNKNVQKPNEHVTVGLYCIKYFIFLLLSVVYSLLSAVIQTIYFLIVK